MVFESEIPRFTFHFLHLLAVKTLSKLLNASKPQFFQL